MASPADSVESNQIKSIARSPGDRSDPINVSISTTAAATATAVAAAATTAAVAAAATAAPTATTAAATTTIFTRLGFVHGEPTPVVLLVVEALDRGLRLGFCVHLDESEALAPTRLAVLNDLRTLHGTELGEQLLPGRTR